MPMLYNPIELWVFYGHTSRNKASASLGHQLDHFSKKPHHNPIGILGKSNCRTKSMAQLCDLSGSDQCHRNVIETNLLIYFVLHFIYLPKVFFASFVYFTVPYP
uniref:Uncharacterized protein n=1 Tax=Cacopsylla melanoneura TaxID=428564 RepID=A0A8D8V1B4_9HEMI